MEMSFKIHIIVSAEIRIFSDEYREGNIKTVL
jgi:hypothetical protein